MRAELVALLGVAASTYGAPLENINLERILDLFPRQSNVTCPSTPNPMPKAAAFPSVKTMPDPFLYLDGKTRVQSKDEWIQCRQPEIMKLLQEYQYGYYPDHSQETVSATRSGNTLTVTVATGGKTATIAATLNLPSGSGPFPVIISIGGMDTKSYTGAGIAVVTFDYGKVAADSNTKSGSFWTLYSGKDIGVLTAWAWGFHRVLDGIELKVPEIDATKSGVTGCSRLGKAALAAGLFDKRIAVTMPMCSGVQGAGPYRYSLSGQGENLENAKSGAGWWTSSGISQFVGKSTQLPYDAHTIVTAIAPRAVILSQNSGDQFTDSKGTAQVTFPAAKVVYNWLGAGEKLGMSIPGGGHCDQSGYADVLPFVQKVLQGKSTTRNFDDLKTWKAMPEAYPWGTDLPKGK
ncbi:carbohydrate esterase family 15 protein [Cucurbitaria berberidis CBS 394.84]|uniref:(4-O-methyl)-D-glucuronate--lignin esterase n=1 Tax=Cucurbitaria berberidis CBS 394.84 TaxID=1168544 RepID=A0A9P4GFR5_9PLEO|nr:carbohydrate esterase family 15 protein [Cucurbitaria berberidis CBS 394.84]KAF1844542.1 carbohydrate esterase family 15 protein [Cucurbitaria berberidis CBS 394.84]